MKKIILSRKSKVFAAFNFVILSFAWGCSQPKFSKDPNFMPCQNSGATCTTGSGIDSFSTTVSGSKGKVDIIFVDDNSASMSFEQAHLAERFTDFIKVLDDNQVDYRIGIVTSDISASNGNGPRAINQNGNLQDGNLIAFSDGSKFLTPSSGSLSTKVNLFNSAIQRPETLACEQFILNWSGSRDSSAYDQAYTANCPSGDERGIYAANLVVKNNPSGILRADANLSFIFLSDEDVRSQLYYWSEPGFALVSNDDPTTLQSNLRTLFPNKQISKQNQRCRDRLVT